MLDIISILKKLEITIKIRSRNHNGGGMSSKTLKAAFWSVYSQDEIVDMEILQALYIKSTNPTIEKNEENEKLIE